MVPTRAEISSETEFLHLQTRNSGSPQWLMFCPQSTTAGWSGNRLNDMEALINTVIAENNVDITRCVCRRPSMGTAMTTPLITSTTDNKIPLRQRSYVQAVISVSRAEIIAEKGFPVYLVEAARIGLPWALAPPQ